jgi:integral membrane protein
VNGALTRYRVMAYVTGVVLLLLVVATVLDWGFDKPEMAAVVGPAHGFLYIVYLITAFDLAVRAKWSFLRTLGVLLAGTIPVMSFVAERKVNGWIHPRPAADTDVEPGTLVNR